MYHYLFTNDLRISSLDESLRRAGRCFVTNTVPTSTEDKSANNNMLTLGFYFTLTSTSVCAKAAANGDIRSVVLNFIKKFQFPNPRTQESFNDSKEDGITLAPMRVIVKALYILSLLYPSEEAYLTKEEIRDFIFYNSTIAKTTNPDISLMISQILETRKTGISQDTIAPEEDRFWKQGDRQIREMIKVLIWSGCVSEQEGRYIVDNNRLTDTQKAAVFDIINCNSFWTGDSVDSYIAYMDMEEREISYNSNYPSIMDLEGTMNNYNRIVFGAPGTGKSFKLEQDKAVFKENYERVTFHPDYSFAQFVGTYKPVSEGGEIKYKYVPGPFVRTLLKAYKSSTKTIADYYDPTFFYSNDVAGSTFYVAPCNVAEWDFFEKAKKIDQIEPWSNPPKAIKPGDIVFIYICKNGIERKGYPKNPGVYGIAEVISGIHPDSDDDSITRVDLKYKALSFEMPIIEESEFKKDNPANPIQNFQNKGNGADLFRGLIEPIVPKEPFLLLIEEINRSNVAAVFGDVFQLLDRDSDGNSLYPVSCGEELKKYFLSEGLCIEKLYIPSNMYIWASMNSADQGVFPMDTAFKRRWEFEYIGINDKEKDMENSTVVLGSGERKHKIKWNDLRHAINDYLAELGINEDKQLGPYFIGRKIVVPENGSEIDSKVFNSVFKNKVLMYLFDDAAKQRRPSVFAGVEGSKNRYSTICEEFDSRGMYIFNDKISSNVVVIETSEDSSASETAE